MGFDILENKMSDDILYWFESADGLNILKLQVTDRYTDIFEKYRDKGFTGDGYDWGAIISLVLNSFDSKISKDVSLLPFTSEVFIISKDIMALKMFKREFMKLYNNRARFEYYISQIQYI